ncbi:MAG: phosphoribosylamine--glycine ligase [Acidobacteriota bacterium]|nr:phosphoribosylamine--glycine ligase [Acidobacteriota bacterium]MDQ7088821.1 phosphoribosylamine--glycine ligase [Acidobacteriota bacterium]
MKVLVLGGGGREHALAWKIRQSRGVEELFCSPGNAGIAEIADCPPLASSDPEAVADFVARQGIDLTVVGPELPLMQGIADKIMAHGRAVFGPTAGAARLEGSKVFAKQFMTRHRIPTAPYEIFDRSEEALAYIDKADRPLVIKADGLAAGKGVFIAETRDQAREAIQRLMIHKAFGGAGRTVVIEECLRGREASFFAISDGQRVIPLVTCQDYKRAYDHGRGPNTGGMGSYSPALHLDRELTAYALEKIVGPTIRGIAAEGHPYRGVLYVGLMLTDDGPRVLEYNCRFGDPETQVILPRLKSDLVPLLSAAAYGDLSTVRVEWRREAAVCVIMASQGYPGHYQKGKKILDIERFTGRQDIVIFHAGTRTGPGGEIRTSGGRVLGVTGIGPTLAAARAKAYEGAAGVTFSGAHYRRDIAAGIDG